MAFNVAYVSYLIALVFACICSLYRFKKIDAAARILSALMCCALINECAAYYLARQYHNNLPLYAFYCFLEYGLLCLYFNRIIDVFVKRGIGVYIAIGGISLGILNLVFIQNINTLNSYFLFFEDLSVIALSLFTFFRLLLKHDSLHLYRYPHFWFITILTFFWSITFLNWGLYDYFNLELRQEAWKINFGILLVGIVTYSGFGLVFLLYPKMRNKYE
jgi:hypothetical protein